MTNNDDEIKKIKKDYDDLFKAVSNLFKEVKKFGKKLRRNNK